MVVHKMGFCDIFPPLFKVISRQKFLVVVVRSCCNLSHTLVVFRLLLCSPCSHICYLHCALSVLHYNPHSTNFFRTRSFESQTYTKISPTLELPCSFIIPHSVSLLNSYKNSLALYNIAGATSNYMV